MPADRALILDFGGVVTRTLFETHDLTERALGLPPGTLDWRGPFAAETDLLWQTMQQGKISEREYWHERTREVGALLGEDWTKMRHFVRAARGANPAAVIRPEFHDALAQVKAMGAKLGILSNELDLFYGADFRTKLPFLEDFDAIIDATYTEILKPDPRAYAQVFDALDIAPENAVFVDDQKRNVDGAITARMQTVHFDVAHPRDSYAQAIALLSQKG